jgi:hypothetical protein
MDTQHAFILIDDAQTGGQALKLAEGHKYVVLRFSDGRFAVVLLSELRSKLGMWQRQGALELPLEEFNRQNPNALQPYFDATQAAPYAPGDPGFQARLEALHPKQPLVLLDGNNFVGLCIGGQTYRGGETKSAEVFTVDAGVKGIALSDSQPQPRKINVEMQDQMGNPYDAVNRPLQVGQVYRLLFDLDTHQRETALVAEDFDAQKAFERGETEITLTIKLLSPDFEITPPERQIKVRKTEPRSEQVTFFVKPTRNGPGVINAVFLKGDTFIQAMTLKFFTGKLFEKEEPLGRPLDSLAILPSRDVNLTILKANDGFQMVLTGAVGAVANLPVSVGHLDYMIAKLRSALKEVVDTHIAGQLVFHADTRLDAAVGRAAAFKLAQEGYRLFDNLFFEGAADPTAKEMGHKLRLMAQGRRLNIQIFSKEFVLPWGVLYLSEEPPREANFDPERFLGLKHVIEHIPLQPGLQVLDSQIDAAQGLQVSLNLNSAIDQEFNQPYVAEQEEYWKKIAQPGRGVTTLARYNADEVLQALSNTDQTPDQVMYFFCHGVSRSLLEGGGPDASALQLTDGKLLTLGDLKYQAGSRYKLSGLPLIFLNACESAELSPQFYDGFVPYFVSKGARGAIGAECKIPARFAKEWARRFFDLFLRGQPVGEIALKLRRDFYYEENNILGLLYSLYLDSQTRLALAVL